MRLAAGTDVLDDLIAGIDQWREERGPKEGVRVVLGCSPWISDDGVVDALLLRSKLGWGWTQVLVLTQKSPTGKLSRAAERLRVDGPGCHTKFVPGLREYGRPDEIGSVDWRSWESDTGEAGAMESVRVHNYLKAGNSIVPMTHAKCLVLGWEYNADTGYGIYEGAFRWDRLWMGSANWTTMSRRHQEIGAWIDDRTVVGDVAWWLGRLIAESEPASSTAPDVSPELELADLPEPDWNSYVETLDDE